MSPPYMSSQYGQLRPTSGWDLLASLGHPTTFQWVSRLGSVTARHSSIGRQPIFAALNRGRHLYPAGRLSRWALAHILISLWYCTITCEAIAMTDSMQGCLFLHNDRFRRNLARWRSLALLTFLIVKIYTIWKSKMAVAAMLENRKITILWPKFDHYAIQGHSRSTIFVPIESSYTTSY